MTWRGAAVAMLWLGLSAAGYAAPQDDYRSGLQSYQRGDVVAAMAVLRQGAAAGHAPSQALLAFIMDRADFVDEAARLYRSAADQADAEGLAGLANLQMTGRGVAKDEKQALQAFSKAAQQGHALAIRVVADAHLSGRFAGIELARDDAAASAAIRRAAEQDYLPAVDALAQAHGSGAFGIAVDAVQATRWRERAAELRRRSGAAPVKAAK